MQNILAWAAGVITCLSVIPYIVDILKGKTHPNIVTWFTWTLLTTIGAIAAGHAHETQTMILMIATTIANGAVMTLAFRFGLRKYTMFDVICQGLALVGIAMWQVSHDATLTTTLAIATDLLAALPTFVHAWNVPRAETWQTFGLDAIPGVMTVASLSHFTFVGLAFPIYLTLNNLLLMSVILARRRSRPAE